MNLMAAPKYLLDMNTFIWSIWPLAFKPDDGPSAIETCGRFAVAPDEDTLHKGYT